MENLTINRGNARRVEITVLGANGVQIQLSKCTDVAVILWINGRSKLAQEVQIQSDIAIAELSASELDYLGEYSAQVRYTDNGVTSTSERVYLFRVANEFYRTASGTGIADSGTLIISVATPDAINKGYSAYEIAVQNGYVGTEQEWLASLSQDSKDAAKVALEAADTALNSAANADAAATAANAAAASVNQAKDAANAAAANANTAADTANAAAAEANSMASKANLAAVAANSAADKANTATTNANAATVAANTATTNANAATTAANAAATNANTAAETANSAATKADTAAVNAKTQGDYAKEQGDRAKIVSDKVDYNVLAMELDADGNVNVLCGADETAFQSGSIKENGDVELIFDYK